MVFRRLRGLLQRPSSATKKVSLEKTPGTRFVLSNRLKARKIAQKRNIRLSKSGVAPKFGAVDGETAENIKLGIIGMADRANIVGDTREIIESMDVENLLGWYDVNPTAFDIYWSYEDVHYHSDMGWYTIGDKKRADIEWFADEYVRLFGDPRMG